MHNNDDFYHSYKIKSIHGDAWLATTHPQVWSSMYLTYVWHRIYIFIVRFYQWSLQIATVHILIWRVYTSICIIRGVRFAVHYIIVIVYMCSRPAIRNPTSCSPCLLRIISSPQHFLNPPFCCPCFGLAVQNKQFFSWDMATTSR